MTVSKTVRRGSSPWRYANKGKTKSEEHKKKIAEAIKRKYNKT